MCFFCYHTIRYQLAKTKRFYVGLEVKMNENNISLTKKKQVKPGPDDETNNTFKVGTVVLQDKVVATFPVGHGKLTISLKWSNTGLTVFDSNT